jgi:hypothetical protein
MAQEAKERRPKVDQTDSRDIAKKYWPLLASTTGRRIVRGCVYISINVERRWSAQRLSFKFF